MDVDENIKTVIVTEMAEYDEVGKMFLKFILIYFLFVTSVNISGFVFW